MAFSRLKDAEMRLKSMEFRVKCMEASHDSPNDLKDRCLKLKNKLKEIKDARTTT